MVNAYIMLILGALLASIHQVNRLNFQFKYSKGLNFLKRREKEFPKDNATKTLVLLASTVS